MSVKDSLALAKENRMVVNSPKEMVVFSTKNQQAMFDYGYRQSLQPR
jgi:hypothetical protein